MSADMIERVARAIHDAAWGPNAWLIADYGEKDKARAQARAAIGAVHEWQPIETAPQDGTRFLAVDQFRQTFICRRHTGASCPEGVWVADGLPRGVIFTHWMPLPTPPRAVILSSATVE